jgi:hypothetical protein
VAGEDMSDGPTKEEMIAEIQAALAEFIGRPATPLTKEAMIARTCQALNHYGPANDVQIKPLGNGQIEIRLKGDALVAYLRRLNGER